MPDKWRILAARHQLSLVPRLPSLTRHPDHLDAEVCGELAQVALLGHLAVLGVGDEVGGHGVLITDFILVLCSAPSVPQPVFTITEKAPTSRKIGTLT